MIVALIICTFIILAVLAFLLYNQMLLINQVNKRLFLLTKESIERERVTMEAYQQSLDELESSVPTHETLEDSPISKEDIFDPHNYDVSQLEE